MRNSNFEVVTMIVFGLSNSGSLAKGISGKAKLKLGKYSCGKFPDGELHIRFLEKVRGKEVLLAQSLSPEPNDSLMELVFAARTAGELGAKKVFACIPYLAYARQDKRFHPGECFSAKEMASLLNYSIDGFITVDPHLHRIKNLKAIFKIKVIKLTSDSLIADYVKRHYSRNDTFLVGPDIESSQWAKKIADSIGFGSTIFLKERFSSPLPTAWPSTMTS